MNLRKYQDDTLHHAYLAEQAGLNRLLVALPTGTGKTIIFGQWLNERKGRAVVIAHRDELIRQAVHKLGLILPSDVTVGVVKAEEHQPEAEVVVASIQSLTPKRLKDLQNVTAIVIDEAHHSEADTYQRALKHLGAYDGVMTLGVTATPYRGDGKDLAKTWQRLVYSMQIKDAIKAGHLCALRAYRVSTRANFSKLKVLHGDVHQGQAGAELLAAGAPEQIAQAVEQHAVGRPTLIFCPTVEVSMEVESAVRKVKRNCLHVDGTTDPGTRANAIKLLQAGGVVTNCGIYCLDAETEILTERGFLRHDELSMKDMVVNWDNGSAWIEHPLDIIVRERKGNEEMYFLETPKRSIRVSSRHRMIYRSAARCAWKKAPVDDIQNRCVGLPNYGLMPHHNVWVKQPKKTKGNLKKRITSNAYILRKKGYTTKGARQEAERRCNLRDTLTYKEPAELTLDECAFIGFWVGDGSTAHPRRFGIEYTLCQSLVYPKIIKWIEKKLAASGIQGRQHLQKNNIIWSLRRGTSDGNNGGVFRLEPFLNKTPYNCKDMRKDTQYPWLYALNKKQFEAFIEGLWYADGDHYKADNGFTHRGRIYSVNKKLLDLLQAVGVVRGWCMNLYKGQAPRKAHHQQIWALSFHKRREYKIGGTKPSYRIQQEQLPWKPELLWCVKTTSRNIITRRRGTVTVMGNTEGFDCPEVSCIVIARPTKSQTLYVQMIGRGTRNHPGKDNCVILDVVGASMRHDLCTAMILAVGASELERELLAKQKKRDETAHGIGGSGPIQVLEIDLWGARPFAWVKTTLGYVLEAGGYGKLLLGQDGDHWALWQRQGEQQKKLWIGDDVGYGQGFAEDWCRGKNLDGLCRKDAPWREARITDGQKHALTKLRIPWTDQTTKGQASDAITWAIANSGRW